VFSGARPQVGTQRVFEGFQPRDHVAIGEALDLVDFDAAAEVGGQAGRRSGGI
jgi:seryl-tRNA synthetase